MKYLVDILLGLLALLAVSGCVSNGGGLFGGKAIPRGSGQIVAHPYDGPSYIVKPENPNGIQR
jgi:hypothetical protein